MFTLCFGVGIKATKQTQSGKRQRAGRDYDWPPVCLLHPWASVRARCSLVRLSVGGVTEPSAANLLGTPWSRGMAASIHACAWVGGENQQTRIF